jgi:cell division transport system ATP-binding protein
MIRLDNVTKVFGTGVSGLEEISLSIEKGEFVFLIGKTGSGKTTLLRLLIREVLPTKGEIRIADVDITKLPAKKLPHLRKKIGVIFQDLKLLMDRTIFENVMLPMEIAGLKPMDAKQRVEQLLAQVDILSHRDKFPIQLSGGELQRAAIARALTLAPDILLADEPTGNLDDKTAFDIVKLLFEISKNGTTVVMATHNLGILSAYDTNRIVKLEGGKIVNDSKQKIEKENQHEKDVPIEKIITKSDEKEKKDYSKKEKEANKHGKAH